MTAGELIAILQAVIDASNRATEAADTAAAAQEEAYHIAHERYASVGEATTAVEVLCDATTDTQRAIRQLEQAILTFTTTPPQGHTRQDRDNG